jgi:hypothetical protein
MMVRPILVVTVWRGGDRFIRCLKSIDHSTVYFSKILISVTSDVDSTDLAAARNFASNHPTCEVICTGVELSTMRHQDFWVTHLERSGVMPNDWIYWLAYDDQIWPQGLATLANDRYELSLDPQAVYFGPWAMRHEQPDRLWSGTEADLMEVWTSFPSNGPTTLPLLTWIGDQLEQPTYIQMSGSVIPFANYLQLRDFKPQKGGPMRIEMATALGRGTICVSEFASPISVIYGRSNSDRANYGSVARHEDIHLIRYLLRYAAAHPSDSGCLFRVFFDQLSRRVGLQSTKAEEWRVRGTVISS